MSIRRRHCSVHVSACQLTWCCQPNVSPIKEVGSQRCNVADRRVVRVFEQRYTFDGKEVGSGTVDSSHIGKVRAADESP